MIPYEKYHGTGNDFVVVDADHHVPCRGAFAARVCDRESGVGAGAQTGTGGGPQTGTDAGAGVERVGADGVLFLHSEPQYRPPRVVMTLVQPDGSTAAMCGNGARVAARWAAREAGTDEVMIDTPAGTHHAAVRGDEVTVEMGRPAFDPAAVPVERDGPLVEERVAGYEVTAVNTGVPHAVAFVEDVSEVDVAADAPPIRHADVFPEGANVTFASQRPDGESDAGADGAFDQRTFERGVEGETRSCGTGAVAVAAVARRLGLVEGRGAVAVHPPGGDLAVEFDDRGVAHLRGPVEREFEGETEPGPVRRLDA